MSKFASKKLPGLVFSALALCTLGQSAIAESVTVVPVTEGDSLSRLMDANGFGQSALMRLLEWPAVADRLHLVRPGSVLELVVVEEELVEFRLILRAGNAVIAKRRVDSGDGPDDWDVTERDLDDYELIASSIRRLEAARLEERRNGTDRIEAARERARAADPGSSPERTAAQEPEPSDTLQPVPLLNPDHIRDAEAELYPLVAGLRQRASTTPRSTRKAAPATPRVAKAKPKPARPAPAKPSARKPVQQPKPAPVRAAPPKPAPAKPAPPKPAPKAVVKAPPPPPKPAPVAPPPPPKPAITVAKAAPAPAPAPAVKPPPPKPKAPACPSIAGSWTADYSYFKCEADVSFKSTGTGQFAMEQDGCGDIKGKIKQDGRTLSGQWRHSICKGVLNVTLDESCNTGSGTWQAEAGRALCSVKVYPVKIKRNP